MEDFNKPIYASVYFQPGGLPTAYVKPAYQDDEDKTICKICRNKLTLVEAGDVVKYIKATCPNCESKCSICGEQNNLTLNLELGSMICHQCLRNNQVDNQQPPNPFHVVQEDDQEIVEEVAPEVAQEVAQEVVAPRPAANRRKGKEKALYEKQCKYCWEIKEEDLTNSICKRCVAVRNEKLALIDLACNKYLDVNDFKEYSYDKINLAIYDTLKELFEKINIYTMKSYEFRANVRIVKGLNSHSIHIHFDEKKQLQVLFNEVKDSIIKIYDGDFRALLIALNIIKDN